MPLKITYECGNCHALYDLGPGSSIRDFISWCAICSAEGCGKCHYTCLECGRTICDDHMTGEHICGQCRATRLVDDYA